MDLLQEVTEQCFPTVLEALKKDWPKHFLPFQMFSVLKGNQWDFIYALYLCGDVETGVYLLKITLPTGNGPMHCLYLYAPTNDLAAVDKVLQESSRIPWILEPFMFEMIPSSFRSLVEKAFMSRGVKCLTMPTQVFTFPADALLVLPEIPQDVYVDFLKEAHSLEVDENWPFRFPGSHLLHRECIKKIFGLGIFRKSDGKILSSSISNHAGGIFVLYTDPECRGKGYAPIVIQYMINEIRKRGKEPFCTIDTANATSLKVFSKLGFRYFDMVDYYKIIK